MRVGRCRCPVDMRDIQEVVAHLAGNIPGARRTDTPSVAPRVNPEAPGRFNDLLLEILGGG
jgi:hypothetical protein